jgi:ATP-dependent helicase/nuclease subunit A
MSGCEHHAVIITLPYPSESRLEEVLSQQADEGILQKAYSEKIGSIFSSLSRKFRDDTVNLAVGHAEKGTVLHFVMLHLDYSREDIEAQIEGMVARDLLTEQQAQSVDVGKIRRFLESPLGKRMLAAGSINREVPFNIEMPCHGLYKDMEDEACHGEMLLLQGVIDCYFEDPDGIVLVDYKTDYAPAGKVEMIRERYRVQILYYARALEMLTGKRVKEKYIYLFWNGEVLEF